MQIKELYLKNFRCFKELSINFATDYTVLIGNNGAGKSSILNALQTALQCLVTAAQKDMRQQKVDYFASSALQESDSRLETKLLGSTLEQQSQYPVIVKAVAELQGYDTTSWNYELSAHLSRTKIGVDTILNYVLDLQKRLSNDTPVVCPLIAYYGTRRQWDKSDNRHINDLQFIPQMNGYVNSLSANPFNIDIMRHWFSRMLLISRKKSIPEFQAVRQAIADCYKSINDRADIKKIEIDYDAELEDIEIQQYFNDGYMEFLPLHYLSDGAKSILAIVSDIAYRMAVLNPHLLDTVTAETDGIVLIDELDMHLHPSWQRKIISSLRSTFPKLQFVFTTHSPTILTNVPRENIRILYNGQVISPDTPTYGHDVNSILREIMHTEIRPDDINRQLKDFSDAIADGNLELAQSILDNLRSQLGDDDSEVVSAKITLDLEKI